MKTIVTYFFVPIFFCSCASQTFYRTGQGSKGETRAIKSFQNYGNLTGNIVYTQEGDSASLEINQPDVENYPIARTAVFDKKGQFVGYNELPIVAGVNNAAVTGELFNGISKGIRSVGSVIGTVLAGMLGIEAAKQAGAAITAWAPKAATTTTTSTVPAVVAPAAEIPAAGSAVTATVPATVVPNIPAPVVP
jgi:hypothetical protein